MYTIKIIFVFNVYWLSRGIAKLSTDIEHQSGILKPQSAMVKVWGIQIALTSMFVLPQMLQLQIKTPFLNY